MDGAWKSETIRVKEVKGAVMVGAEFSVYVFKASTQGARTQSVCSTQMRSLVRTVKPGRSDRERETWFQDA